MALCDHYNVPILEDAAESLEPLIKEKQAALLANLVFIHLMGTRLSLHLVEGCWPDNPDLIANCFPQPNHVILHLNQHSELGFNYRMSNILAGIDADSCKCCRIGSTDERCFMPIRNTIRPTALLGLNLTGAILLIGLLHALLRLIRISTAWGLEIILHLN